MPRSKYQIKHPDINHMIHFFLDLYYTRLEEDPFIRPIEKNHLKTIENIDKHYRKSFDWNKHLDREKYEEAYLQKIDLLTQALTNKRKKDEKQQLTKQMATKTHEDAEKKRKLLAAHGIHT